MNLLRNLPVSQKKNHFREDKRVKTEIDAFFTWQENAFYKLKFP